MNNYGQAQDWEPTNYEPEEPPTPRASPYAEKPARWYADNAAVHHALELWQQRWDEHREAYEAEHGRPPSSHNREKNKAIFRRQLCEMYGRGEPDPAWIAERISWLEKRGMAADRSERGFR